MFDLPGRKSDPSGGVPDGSARAAEVEACWARVVQAELSSWDTTATALLDADMDADEWVLPAGYPGWITANVSLLDDLLGESESELAGLAPGLDLAGALAAFSVEHMTAGQLGDAAAGWERLIAWAKAQQASVVAELTRRPEVQADNPDGRYASLHPIPVTAGDLCTVWPWTKPQAERVVSWGVDLVDRFPAVHQALGAGRIDQTRARILTAALCDHDPEVARMVEAAVLPHVHKWTSVKVSQVVNRLLHEIAPQKAKDARRDARRDRRVWVDPAKDGMAWLQAYLPAEDAQAIMVALTAAAEALRQRDDEILGQRRTGDDPPGQRRTGDDPPGQRRTLDQARADALAGLAWSSLFTGHLGGDGCAECGAPSGVALAQAHGRPVSVNMTMPLTTWLGLDEHPAELEGYGPIDADTARHLAAAGIWRWVLTDPVGGHALDYGRTRYVPPQDLVDFILLRDRECIMPGCHRSAYRCEIDHRVPYPQGPTSACNCSSLCKTCHLQKHRARWKVEQLAPEVQRWTGPTGHQRIVQLPRIAPPAPVPEPDPPPF